jgi:hypothetical protein
MAATLRLCDFATLREMGLLIQAAVLAKTPRRKGREAETRQLILEGFNWRPLQ